MGEIPKKSIEKAGTNKGDVVNAAAVYTVSNRFKALGKNVAIPALMLLSIGAAMVGIDKAFPGNNHYDATSTPIPTETAVPTLIPSSSSKETPQAPASNPSYDPKLNPYDPNNGNLLNPSNPLSPWYIGGGWD